MGDRTVSLPLRPQQEHPEAEWERLKREELLRRQLDREHRAREEAERLLEDRSNELYAARLRAEAAEAALRDALRSLDDGLLLFDREGRLILANRRFREIYPESEGLCRPGIEEAELWRSLVAAGAFAGGSRRIPAQRSGGRQRTTERWERLTAGGRHVCIIEHETEAGQRVSVHRDVTEIHTAEAQLQWRLAAIEEAADGIAITDDQGVYSYLNAAHARILKHDSAASLIGRSWRSLYDEEELARFDAEIIPQLNARGVWQGTTRALDRFGLPFQQELSLNLLPGGGILCVMRDVTDKALAEAEQQRVMQRLYEAERMEAVGQLARVVAHDFNNILSAISAFAASLQAEVAGQPAATALLERIAIAVDHAEEVVERLQGSYANRPVSMGRVDLVRLARDTCDMLRATLQPGQDLRVMAGRADVPVLGDHAQLGQMVMNFLVNARDALGDAPGTIRVRIDESGEPTLSDPDWSYRVRQGRMPAGCRLASLAVEDSGCGKSQTVIERAFEPDFSTKNGKAVRGLGLSAARSVAEAHGGLVCLESTPHKGSRASLWLPVYRMQLPKSARILVIDDDPLAGEALTTLLSGMGHRSDLLDHPEEALGVLADDPAAWDLVITDQQMPRLNGATLAQRLLDLRPELPVIICTGLPGVIEAIPANVASVIKKPVDNRILHAVLADEDQQP